MFLEARNNKERYSPLPRFLIPKSDFSLCSNTHTAKPQQPAPVSSTRPWLGVLSPHTPSLPFTVDSLFQLPAPMHAGAHPPPAFGLCPCLNLLSVVESDQVCIINLKIYVTLVRRNEVLAKDKFQMKNCRWRSGGRRTE